MKNKILNFLNYLSLISKYLILISFIVFNTSCEKEEGPQQSLNFQNYLFKENVKCYDIKGSRLDSLSYMYSQNDFIYSTDFELPYENIEINADGTVNMYYMEDDKRNIKTGRVTLNNDSLYFYSNLSSNDLIFKGLLVDNQLRIPGYGYIYYTFLSNGVLNMTEEVKIIKLGIPEVENLIKKFPPPSLTIYNTNIQRLYIQRFDLIYQIKFE